MPNTMNPRDRLQECLSGAIPDRPPVALWRHFPVDDQTPDGLASAVANFQRLYDFDFIKVTPASTFCTKDWGTRDVWRGNPEGTREITNFVIQNPADWLALRHLDPTNGCLGDQIQCLQWINGEFSRRTPVIQTIFSPLAQAKNLVGKENLVRHLRKNPEELRCGLDILTRTTLDFIAECKKTGIDGIFYAVQHANYGILSLSEFNDFGREYDLKILAAVQDLWLNVGHIHGDEIMFDQVSDYPVSILNWHDRHTFPSLSAGKGQFQGAVCGGLRQWESLVLGDPAAVRAEALDAIHQAGNSRFILGTGCVVPITAPAGNLAAARMSVENL